MFQLMQEAQDIFAMEWDPLPPPELGSRQQATSGGIRSAHVSDLIACRTVDLDTSQQATDKPYKTQAFTLWLRSADFQHHRHQAAALITHLLNENPYTTLQVILEPPTDSGQRATDIRQSLSRQTLETLMAVCQQNPTYLDRFYALQPGRPIGAKRLVVLLPLAERSRLDPAWIAEVGDFATLVWRGTEDAAMELEEHEYVLA
jgi:hypothetical protein